MLTFFTDPYPDELLLSAISRYHYYSGNKLNSETSKEIYEFNRSDASENYLDGLVSNLGGTYTKKELIFEHTLFPIKCFFHNETKYDDSFLHINRRLFFCPECAKNDIENFGEAYFHREHQIKNIIMCPKHRVKLRLYSSKNVWNNRWNYNKFDYKNLYLNDKKLLDASQYDKLWNISKMFYKLLSDTCNKWVNETVLNFYFIKLLREQGFINSDGIYNKINLEEEVINSYGDAALSLLDEDYRKYKNLRWINDGSSVGHYNPYSSSPYFNNPLHIIIMICFFRKRLNNIIDEIEIDYKKFIKNPCDSTLWNSTFKYYVKKFNLYHISNKMDISINKVFEYAKKLNIDDNIKPSYSYICKEEIDIYKEQILELIRLNPGISRSQLSRILKVTRYELILLRERDWWEENAPKRLKKMPYYK